MARVVSIGRQDFEKIRTRNNFYIDKNRLHPGMVGSR